MCVRACVCVCVNIVANVKEVKLSFKSCIEDSIFFFGLLFLEQIPNVTV